MGERKKKLESEVWNVGSQSPYDPVLGGPPLLLSHGGGVPGQDHLQVHYRLGVHTAIYEGCAHHSLLYDTAGTVERVYTCVRGSGKGEGG
jgi:hypothetical protein